MNDRVLLRLTGLPVYQNKMYPDSRAALACPRGDLVLVQDRNTGLVHNAAFDSSLLVYDETYQNEQSHSAAFQTHLEDVLGLIDNYFAGLTILEVGCGKGAFLQLLRERGHSATGIDPAYEGSELHITRGSFGLETGARAEAVVMRHTLEHIADPLAFLHMIHASNDGQGLIYIEVPCLDWIVEHHAWYDFFYEHVNYFRLDDFHRVFDRVIDSGRLFGGQYIYIIADLETIRPTTDLTAAAPVAIPEGIFSDIDRVFASASGSSRRVIWGAGAKGMMFAYHAALRGLALDFAIDINPAKQAGFLAGTGLPVLSPEAGLEQLADGDHVFVMNSNYIDEITRAGGIHLHYTVVDSK